MNKLLLGAGSSHYAVAQCLVKLLPAITWKASKVSNAFIALGDEVGKQTVFLLLLAPSEKI